MKNIFNLEALVRVEIVEKKECYYLTYKPYKKSFWGDTKAGFYHIHGGERCYTKEEIEDRKFCDTSLFVENNIAYYFPYVKLHFAGEIGHVREFKTYDEAEAWGTEMSNKGMNVRLTKDSKIYVTD